MREGAEPAGVILWKNGVATIMEPFMQIWSERTGIPAETLASIFNGNISDLDRLLMEAFKAKLFRQILGQFDSSAQEKREDEEEEDLSLFLENEFGK